MMLYKYSWRNNIHALLDSGFRAIPVDLPGHGQTDIPPDPYPYTVNQVANDIVTMTNKLGLEQIHLKRNMINPIS